MTDYRSGTVTRPTRGMLEAMMRAGVGDDIFGEDPTLNTLQEKDRRLIRHGSGIVLFFRHCDKKIARVSCCLQKLIS